MLRLKKSLGQTFLSDKNIINKISSLEKSNNTRDRARFWKSYRVYFKKKSKKNYSYWKRPEIFKHSKEEIGKSKKFRDT